MKIIERMPIIGKKIGEMKYGVVSMLNKSIDMSYKKAINNFVVLGMGLESGVPIPKVVSKCEKFFKLNKKESEFSEKMCSKLDSLFKRIEMGNFEPEDGVWVKKIVVPYLKDRQRSLKLSVMKMTLR